MSVFGLERSETAAPNKYDHTIDLIDKTKPQESTPEIADNDSTTAPLSTTESGTLLGRQLTKRQGHLRKELARRKYAKYQKERDGDDETPTDSGSEAGNTPNPEKRASLESERTSRLRDKIPFRTKKRAVKARKDHSSFIDVLYENQRGSFFCGIPLYSSKSLLNFDPSPWQTANFQDSAVNITNFQLPDPSWVWDWKTWYVDMSRDVDEEGWEYSFSFNRAYAWHGNHPWLFSFTRRRRWLRRRVKLHTQTKDKSKTNQAHMLNEDYFTIHGGRRNRSRGSSMDRTTTHGSSFMNGLNYDCDDDQELYEISNIKRLMAALKRARVDREKVSAFKTFLEQGGDELFYLADSISEIKNMLIYQTSQRQLQTSLLQSLDAATTAPAISNEKGKEIATEEQGSNDDQDEARKRKSDNLLKAIHAAGVHINDLDYWSDLRARVTGSETDPTNETHALDATKKPALSGGGPHPAGEDDEAPVKEEIRGIPDDAQVSRAPQLRFANPVVDKGKGKA